MPHPNAGTNENLLPCPYDTDGDGGCANRLCPWCSPQGRQNRLSVERNSVANTLLDKLTDEDDEWGEQNHPLIREGIRDSVNSFRESNAIARARLEYSFRGEEDATKAMELAIKDGKMSWAHLLGVDYGRVMDALVTMSEYASKEALIALAATAMNMVRSIDRGTSHEADVIRMATRRMRVPE